MSRLLLPLVAVAALLPYVDAGVTFTSPKAGASLTAGRAIDVKWEDDGESPKLTELLTYELFLCAGGNEDGSNVSTGRLYCSLVARLRGHRPLADFDI